MNDETNKILMDMSERLVRLETKIDAMSDTRDIANKALTKSEENERRLNKIDKIIFWTATTIIGAVILGLIGLLIAGGV